MTLAIPLTTDVKSTIFRANYLNIENFTPPELDEFLEVEKRAFDLS
jgi:hypothetical protein